LALALDLHKELFEAIENKFGEDADLLQLVPDSVRIDFVPEDKADQFPQVVVEQGEEGGAPEIAASTAGYESVDEHFSITFNVRTRTRGEASQIVWQIVSLFTPWSEEYDRISVGSCERQNTPWVGQVEQGVCGGSVSFLVSVSPIEE
jgi:hypothetical protein